MIVKERIILYLYILLWFIYELQGIFFASGSAFSLAIILLFTAISFFYFFKVNLASKKKTSFFIVLNLLVVMFTIYGIAYVLEEPPVTIGVSQSKPYNYLKAIYKSLLPIYTFYYFTKKNVITQSFLQKIVPIFFVVVIASFWQFDVVRRLELVNNGIEGEDVVNYKCYAFLSLFITLTVYQKKMWIQILGMTCIMAFLLIGMKRGAIFVGLICMALYSLVLCKSTKGYKKLLIIGASIAVVILLLCLFYYLMDTYDFFNKRLQKTIEGNTSGRDGLFYVFFNYYLYETTPIQFLFGSGANATLSISYNYAHNDWLELAVNQGVVGLSLYLCFWYSIFRFWKSMDRSQYTFFAFSLFVVICFMKTLFSRTYNDMDIYTTCMLGSCLGMSHK